MPRAVSRSSCLSIAICLKRLGPDAVA
jgi:hypothetical protein